MRIGFLTIFSGWGLVFNFFQIRNSVGEYFSHFAVRIYLFRHFRRGQNLEYIFSLGTELWPIFPVGRGSSGSARRSCQNELLRVCLQSGVCIKTPPSHRLSRIFFSQWGQK